MAEDQAVELPQSGGLVRVLCRQHFPCNEGMAAHGALAENHQIPGKNIRTLDRDPDRHAHVGVGKVVHFPHDQTAAAMDVHGILNDETRLFRHVVLGDGGHHRGFYVFVDGTGGHDAGRFQLIGVPGNARQRLFDTFEIADRQIEL